MKATVRRIVSGELDCPEAQGVLDNIARTIPSYPVWLVCLATGLACAAFRATLWR